MISKRIPSGRLHLIFMAVNVEIISSLLNFVKGYEMWFRSSPTFRCWCLRGLRPLMKPDVVRGGETWSSSTCIGSSGSSSTWSNGGKVCEEAIGSAIGWFPSSVVWLGFGVFPVGVWEIKFLVFLYCPDKFQELFLNLFMWVKDFNCIPKTIDWIS